MTDKLDQSLNELLTVLHSSETYLAIKESLELVEQNKIVKELTDKIKKLQKQSLITNSLELEKEISETMAKLYKIPEYQIYVKSVKVYNETISHINQTINDYVEDITKI